MVCEQYYNLMKDSNLYDAKKRSSRSQYVYLRTRTYTQNNVNRRALYYESVLTNSIERNHFKY